MNLPADVQRLLPIIAVVLVALGAAVLVTRGLGGEAAGSAQQVLDRAIQEEPHSAAVSMRLTFAVKNASTGKGATAVDWIASGDLTDSSQGNLSNGRIHLAERTANQTPVSLDEVAAGDQGFIRLGGRWYRVSPAQYKRIFRPGGKTSLIEALEFDPRKWIRDPKLEGTARVDGVEANHLSGDVDTDAMLTDMDFYKQDPNESASERRLTQFVRSAKKHGNADLYAGKQDGILRKLSVTSRIEPSGGGAPLRGTLTFAVGFGKVNQPVKVAAPGNALPPARIAQIPRSKLGGEADEVLGPASAPPAASHAPKRHARARPHHRTRPTTKRYLNCVQAAEDLQALERCQALLP